MSVAKFIVNYFKRGGQCITVLSSLSFPPYLSILVIHDIHYCEGYSGIRIQTDDSYIRNVASGGAPYIFCGYMQLRTLDNSTTRFHTTY